MSEVSNRPKSLGRSETLADFADWLNNWGDENLRVHNQWGKWRRQIWRDGYEQAMRDANKHFSRVFPGGIRYRPQSRDGWFQEIEEASSHLCQHTYGGEIILGGIRRDDLVAVRREDWEALNDLLNPVRPRSGERS